MTTKRKTKRAEIQAILQFIKKLESENAMPNTQQGLSKAIYAEQITDKGVSTISSMLNEMEKAAMIYTRSGGGDKIRHSIIYSTTPFITIDCNNLEDPQTSTLETILKKVQSIENKLDFLLKELDI